jgi:hypothetical protein
MKKRIAFVSALAIAAVALGSFIACSSPEDAKNEVTPAAPSVPAGTKTEYTTVTIPLKPIEASLDAEQTRYLDGSSATGNIPAKAIIDYYEVYFQEKNALTKIYFGSVKKGADNLAVSVRATAGGVNYDVLFLAGKKLSSGAILLASSLDNDLDAGDPGWTPSMRTTDANTDLGTVIMTGRVNKVTLPVQYLITATGGVDASDEAIPYAYLDTGYSTIEVASSTKLRPYLLLGNAKPLIEAGFAGTTATEALTALDHTSAPWLKPTAGSTLRAKFFFDPLGSGATWQSFSASFDYLKLPDTNTIRLEYGSNTGGLDLSTSTYAASYGKLYAVAEFYPFGQTAVGTRWSLWPGFNFEQLQTHTGTNLADRGTGGAILVQVDTPAYPLDPADTGMTSIAIDTVFAN